MQAERQHWRGEQTRVVDAHGVHPAQRKIGVALGAVLVLALLAAAHCRTGNAATHLLIAAALWKQRQAERLAERLAKLPDHRLLDVFINLREVIRFVMVRVDIHDHEVAVLALTRLPGRVSQELRGVEFLNREPVDVVRGWQFHGILQFCASKARSGGPSFWTLAPDGGARKWRLRAIIVEEKQSRSKGRRSAETCSGMQHSSLGVCEPAFVNPPQLMDRRSRQRLCWLHLP